MSKQNLLNELVANGYQPKDLVDMPTEDLALLVQEEYVANTWSPEARAAAAEARKHNDKATRKSNKTLSSGTRKEMASRLKAFRKKTGERGRGQHQFLSYFAKEPR